MRRRSEGTRTQYGYHLSEFEAWAGDRPIAELTAHEIQFKFLADWMENKSSATIRLRMAALRSLFTYAEVFDLVARNPMRKIEAPPHEEKGNWLREQEDMDLLESCTSPAERAIFYLLRFTGLRLSEAIALEWRDIDFTNGRLTVRKSKTSAGMRTIPLHPMLVPVLKSWQGERPGPFVLATSKGTAMVPTYVGTVVRRVGKRIGVERLSPHSLRRTFGSASINDGIRLEVVSRLLGHSSTAITEKAYAFLQAETIAAEAMTAWGGGGARA